MSTNIRVEKICLFCSELFIAQTTVTKYCSNKCSSRAWKKRKRQKKLQDFDSKQRIDFIETNTSAKEVLSINDLMILFGVSRSTIYRARKNKTIKSLKIGRRVFFLKKNIYELFNSS